LLSAALRARLVAAQREDWLATAREAWDSEEIKQARAMLVGFMRVHFSDLLASRLFP
jgi:hypothetical protein